MESNWKVRKVAELCGGVVDSEFLPNLAASPCAANAMAATPSATGCIRHGRLFVCACDAMCVSVFSCVCVPSSLCVCVCACMCVGKCVDWDVCVYTDVSSSKDGRASNHFKQ